MPSSAKPNSVRLKSFNEVHLDSAGVAKGPTQPNPNCDNNYLIWQFHLAQRVWPKAFPSQAQIVTIIWFDNSIWHSGCGQRPSPAIGYNCTDCQLYKKNNTLRKMGCTLWVSLWIPLSLSLSLSVSLSITLISSSVSSPCDNVYLPGSLSLSVPSCFSFLQRSFQNLSDSFHLPEVLCLSTSSLLTH